MTASDAIESLIALCPGISPSWSEHLEFWGDDERGHFNDISVVSQFVVDSYQAGRTEWFREVFDQVERLVSNTDEDIRGLAIVGLLENIQNSLSWTDEGYHVFEPWLGPKSLEAWRELEVLWEGKSSLLDLIREQKLKSQGEIKNLRGKVHWEGDLEQMRLDD